MEKNMQPNQGMEGYLPSMAPLANPYVPFQLANPPKYEPHKGLVRGTLFPGLDLPFMGMVNKNEKKATPMTDLQTMAFVIQELALYLDTHRDDQEALEMYHAYQQMYHDAMKTYQHKYRPLNHQTPSDGGYAWLDDPWPWEYSCNREG